MVSASPLPDADVGDHRHLALGGDVDAVGAQAGGDLALGRFHLVAVDRQHDDAIVGVAGDERALAVGREYDVARAGLLGLPTVTLPAGVTVLPLMVKTETVPSARLATRASVPALLMAMPGGALAGLQRGEHLGAAGDALWTPDRRLQAADEARLQRREIDDRHPVVGDLLGRVGRIDHHVGGDESDVLLRRNRHVGRRTDHAVGNVELGQHLGRRWRAGR